MTGSGQLAQLHRRSARALGLISAVFVVGLACSLAGFAWMVRMHRESAALDSAILDGGARLAQGILLAERSYQRFLLTGEPALLREHRVADASIGDALDGLERRARDLAAWLPDGPRRVADVRGALADWRAAYVGPAITGRLKHLWRELEIFRSNRGEAAWVTRLDAAILGLRRALSAAALARDRALRPRRSAAVGLLTAGLLLQTLALLVLVPAGVHGLTLLRDRGRLAVALMEGTERIQHAPDETAIAAALVESAVRDAGATRSVVLQASSSGLAAAAVAGQAVTGVVPDSPVLAQPALCPVIRTGQSHFVADVRSGQACACPLGVPNRGGYLCLPLTTRDRVHGLLNVQGAPRMRLAADHLQDHFAALARVASLVLTGHQLLEQARHQAVTDALTGAYNRRYFESSLAQHLHAARRRQAPLAILMLDLDRFKQFNDAHGHQAGDALLEAFGRMAGDALRRDDVLARYGGEEFVVLLPNTGKPLARRIAERIRTGTRNLFLPQHPDLLRPVASVSIGVSEYPRDGATAEELLKAADDALYQAKGAGRDRVLAA